MTVNEIYCKGKSMVPTIQPGDLLLVDVASVPTVGDVIVFKTPHGEQYVHRYIKKVDGEIITRGDNIRTIDDFRITEKEILGVVTSKKRGNTLTKVSGGKVGTLTGNYRNLQKKYRRWYVQPLLYTLHLKPLCYLLSIVGDTLFTNRLSLIRGEKDYIKICYRKHTLGSYCKKSRQFFIRPVMQPFFSTETLQKIIERVGS